MLTLRDGTMLCMVFVPLGGHDDQRLTPCGSDGQHIHGFAGRLRDRQYLTEGSFASKSPRGAGLK